MCTKWRSHVSLVNPWAEVKVAAEGLEDFPHA